MAPSARAGAGRIEGDACGLVCMETNRSALRRSANGNERSFLLRANTADGAQRHVRIAFFALIWALLATAIFAPAFADAAKKKKKPAKITVMKRNVYLGADLGPAVGAPRLAEA